MSLNYKTPGYLMKFKCLGADCPDTCCQHWDIKLDRKHYVLLSELMQTNEEQKNFFEKNVKLNEQPVTSDHDYARIQMTESGECSMLEESGLCTIHRQYGINTLGNTCAFFPRVISRCEQEIEMSGALSCLEIARLCLEEKSRVKLTHFKLSDLPLQNEYPINRELPHLGVDFYAKEFKKVRSTLLEILTTESYGLDARLYSLASFSSRASGFYHKGCSDSQPMLDDLIHRTLPDIDRLDKFVGNYASQEPVGLIVIHSILQIKQQRFPEEHTSQMAELIYQDYINEINPQDKNSDVDAKALQCIYHKHIVAMEQSFPGKLDQYLTRYLENCFFREWFYTMPDVFTYVQMLLIRQAILRFLILSHQDIVALVRQQLENPSTALEDALREKVIYIVYNFARAVDQNMAFLQVIFNAVSEQEMMNHDYSLAFIKL